MGYFGQKSRQYENEECEKEKASTQLVQQNRYGKDSVNLCEQLSLLSPTRAAKTVCSSRLSFS